jgi:hypothetical protein
LRGGLLTLLVLFVWSAAAWAEDVDPSPNAGGGVGESSFWVGITTPEQGGSPGYIPADDTAAPSPYRYVWVPLGTGSLAPVDPQCDAGFGQVGRPFTMIVQDLSGAVVNLEGRCVPLNGAGVAALPQLSPVPSIAEIWRAALRDIDRPALGLNPRPTGLTGLDTWLWYEGPSELAVSASIREWTVTGTAHLDEVIFDMGDGGSVTAHSPGAEAEPAAHFTYETKGTYDVEVAARWEADLVLTGPGLPARPTPIGSAVLRSSERYPVQEVRGVLVE